MADITLYTTSWCPYCLRAKRLLHDQGLEYEEIDLDGEPGFRDRLVELTGRWTVPQILIDGEPIGGYDELAQLARSGRLAELVA
ncbi:MAG: glutaredoxin 3 [Thermoleophilia bacterium]